MGTKLKSVQWHLSHVVLSCHMALTLPYGTTGTWHVITIKKKLESDTCVPLMVLIMFFWKKPNWDIFSTVETQLTFFFSQVPT